jgi:hypothetical protein
MKHRVSPIGGEFVKTVTPLKAEASERRLLRVPESGFDLASSIRIADAAGSATKP